MAIQIDVVASTLYGYVGGSFYPQLNNLYAICNRYHISPNELFDGLYDFKNSEASSIAQIIFLLNTLAPDGKTVANKVIDSMIHDLAHQEMCSLGGKIRALRKHKRMTAKILADQIAIGESSVRNIESNNAFPSVEILLKLSLALSVSPEYLICDGLIFSDMKRYSLLYPIEIRAMLNVLNVILN